MTVVTANGAGNTTVANIFKSYLLDAINLTPTSFVLTTGTTTVTVTGFGFVYDPDLGLTAGTITGVSQSSTGSTLGQTWTGLNVSGVTAVQTLLTGNLDAFTNLFFTGDDTFNVTLPNFSQNLQFLGYGGNDTFNFSGGADDFYANGGDGDDTFNFNAYTGVIDGIDGGTGINTVNFNAGYSDQQSPYHDGSGNINISNVQRINLGVGFNYSFLAPINVATTGNTVTVDGSALGAANTLTFITHKGTSSSQFVQGNLLLSGGAGNDYLQGGLGNDTFNGGAGTDTVSYDFGNFGSGVTINLGLTTAQAVGGGWGSDTFSSIENLIGTSFDDTLTGNASDNILNPGTGGHDVLDGGAGNDTAIVNGNVSLAISGPQVMGFGNTLSLTSIENLTAVGSNSVLEGDSGNNVLDGAGGTVSFVHATGGVTVDLTKTGPQAVGGGMGTDTLKNFQRVIGSSYDDTFIAATNAFTYPDQSSSDLFDGGAGFDTVDFSHVSGPVTFGLPYGSTSIEHVIGSNYDDQMVAWLSGSILDGGAGNDTLSTIYPGAGGPVQMLGGAGDDTIKVFSVTAADKIDGGTGNDTVSLPAFAGNLSLTFGATTMTNVEALNLDEANYQLVTNDATVASGATLTVQFPQQNAGFDAGLSLWFDGSAEKDGRFIINSFAGNDTLRGGAGSDQLNGGGGNDVLRGDGGTNALDGGTGTDTAAYTFAPADYVVTANSNGSYTVQGPDPASHGSFILDTLTNIENASFDGTGQTLTLAQFAAQTFNPLAYIASYPDLIAALGDNQAAGLSHFLQYGFYEGRHVTFDGLNYIATYPDLMAALGANTTAGLEHYINFGIHENRHAGTFNALQYIASYPDLILAFGDNLSAATAHYITYGYHEGRTPTFNALVYIASNPDMINQLGDNQTAAMEQYVTSGFSQGRGPGTFNALQYIASYPDLIAAFGDNQTAGLEHYINHGYQEGRTATFNALQYIASYPDLIAAFGDNQTAGLEHYINHGIQEGRTPTFNILEYLASNPDLALTYGSNAQAGLEYYIQQGHLQNRPTNSFDPIAYLFSYPDLENAYLTPQGATVHYLAYGVKEGRSPSGAFGTEQTQHVLTVGTTVTDTIGTAGDHDWFSVNLGTSQNYHISVAGLDSGSGTLADPILQIRNEYGQLLDTENGGGVGRDAATNIINSSPGLWYITVASNAAGGTGTYKILVSQI